MEFHEGIQVMGQDISTNCSVYALTSGNITFQDFTNGTWYGNLTSFLPAYYVTNCSISSLQSYLAEFNITTTSQIVVQSEDSTYNQSGNGDTFVALLFTVSGTCISSWMLTLLLYLSPKHKRKPFLTHLATISFSVVLTILMVRLTEISAEQYSADELELVSLQSYIYTDNLYRVTTILSQFCAQLAWFQIVLFIIKPRLKYIVLFVGTLLLLARTVTNIVFEVLYDSKETLLHFQISNLANNWRIARVIIMLVIIACFSVCLLYYTVFDKNPRKISYSRRLLPLAFFNWLVLMLHALLNLFSITLFNDDWQTNIWLSLIPFYFDIIILTTVWEWIFNISVLEKRQELVGVLGRRISVDDVTSLDSKSKNARSYAIYEEGANIFNKLMSFFGRKHTVSKDEIISQTSGTTATTKDLSNIDTPDTNEAHPLSTNLQSHGLGPDQTQNEAQGETQGHTQAHTQTQSQMHTTSASVSDTHANNIHHHLSRGSMRDAAEVGGSDSFDEEYVDYQWDEDDDDHSDSDIDPLQHLSPADNPASTSQQNHEHPPPFAVHPGFNAEDYWNDRKG